MICPTDFFQNNNQNIPKNKIKIVYNRIIVL